MAKPKVRREGVIITKFPPPVPHDLDSQLSWAVAKSLGKAGGCTAAADPDGDGWAMDVRVAKPEATADWAQRLITLLRKRKVARQSTMELSVRTGPIEASVYSAGDDAGWSSLLPAESESAWADVFIKIPGRVTDYDTLVARAYASRFLRLTAHLEDFFEKSSVRGGGDPLAGNAHLGRMLFEQA
ncbi:MAG TPA: hypothetical protein VKD72_40245, partial [Gemmataceae bacterium]|nr:hypothetical protein [Gemmataceae bacterium]